MQNMELQKLSEQANSKFTVELEGAALSIHLSVLNLIGSIVYIYIYIRDVIQMARLTLTIGCLFFRRKRLVIFLWHTRVG